MPPQFIRPNREQGLLLPPSLRDWLPADHQVWFIIDTVERMDLSAFCARARMDGKGGAWYEPKMMATLLIYAYAQGVRSSRRIEQLCQVDVAFRVICGNLRPDHSSIARFRQQNESAFESLFLAVLSLCREVGLLKVGIIAVDGTKMQGNTSLSSNRTEKGLMDEVKRIMTEARNTDDLENKLYGEHRGDELPAQLRHPNDRVARIEECLRQIRERKQKETDEHAAKKKDREEREAMGKKLRGRKPKEPISHTEPKANMTDPDSRIMKNGKGYHQGYNAQAVANQNQVIIAAEVTQDQNDKHQLHPMIRKAVTNLRTIGQHQLPRIGLADAGYASEKALRQPLAGDIEGIVAVRNDDLVRTNGIPVPRGRIPKAASASERMHRKTMTKRGKALYKLRGQIIEPVFGQIKTSQQKFNRFSRRGRTACDSEWKLICSVHNLLKVWKTKGESSKR